MTVLDSRASITVAPDVTDEVSERIAGRGWTIDVSSANLTLHWSDGQLALSEAAARDLSVRRRWMRWHLCQPGERPLALPGLKRTTAEQLRTTISRLTNSSDLRASVCWATKVLATVSHYGHQQRWLPNETIQRLNAERPAEELIERIRQPRVEALMTAAERDALTVINTGVEKLVSEANPLILANELRDRRSFLDRIEKTPLTDEQAEAVVCFDNRVHILAAAGSGKTSVMVARAGYAVERGFVDPDRILLLAFNRAAAKELQDRIESRFKAAGIPSAGVRASTFHAFGLELIGTATGQKPRLASWAEPGQDVRTVQEIVDQLRDASPRFRYRWDLFRTLFASAPPRLDGDSPDSYDKSSSRTGFGTFRNEIVKSEGERLIANWLYLNGVNYRYEESYSHSVADAEHSQYRPDFYYPDIDVWHEHWGIDRDGNPPPEFTGYAESMQWKRQLHSEHGTTLVETTWADVMFGAGLAELEARLVELGLEMDWNPDRPIPGTQPIRNEDLVKLVRTFMAHVKSNSLTREAIAQRLRGERTGLAGYRTQLFLDLYWPIHDEWNQRLRADNLVDFDDMLVLAADHLEAERIDAPYDLIMVDEFQDSSQTRARVIAGLLRKPDKYLLAVGDDWQAINRFAGADISVMTDFERWFGDGPTLRLSTTFRCPQSICDVSSSFVAKNPRQFRKAVRSASNAHGAPVTLIQADDVELALANLLEEISQRVAREEIVADAGRPITVDVLGRYGFDKQLLPSRLPTNLDVNFRTAHGSKGLEADFVVLPRMVAGRWGFPSSISDDQVLDLVMSAPDGFAHAEERRLFYVALTRARREVTLITQPGRESPFIVELINDGRLATAGSNEVEVCAACGEGTMVPRTGPYGRFLGCSRFPACRSTAK